MCILKINSNCVVKINHTSIKWIVLHLLHLFVQGQVGNAGTDGVMGPQGAFGEMGSRGETGEQGIVGEQGNKGPAGPVGMKGEQGEMGPSGMPTFLPLYSYSTSVVMRHTPSGNFHWSMKI